VIALGDGTAKVDGIVAAQAGAAFDSRLTQLASAVCRDDPRTVDQRRSDALEAMAEVRKLGCLCGAADCPNKSDDTAPAVRIVVNVIAGSETVLGTGSEPGYIEGYGVIVFLIVQDVGRNVVGGVATHRGDLRARES